MSPQARFSNEPKPKTFKDWYKPAKVSVNASLVYTHNSQITPHS